MNSHEDESAGIGKRRSKPIPHDTSEVLARRNHRGAEFGEIVQEGVIHWLDNDFLEKPIEHRQVHDHACIRVDLALHGDFYAIVMAVTGRAGTTAEGGLIPGRFPLGSVISMTGRELHGSSEARSGHAPR